MSESKLPIKGQYTQRALALQVIYAAIAAERDAKEVLIELCTEGGFEIPENDSLSQRIVVGVGLDANKYLPIISKFSQNWPIDRISILTKIILTMAFWELENKTAPNPVIVDQAVELAKAFAEQDSYRFVNGVLDRYLKSLVS